MQHKPGWEAGDRRVLVQQRRLQQQARLQARLQAILVLAKMLLLARYSVRVTRMT